MRINFFHHHQTLIMLGKFAEKYKKKGKRREVFLIADDEQLIGCQLFEGKNDLEGGILRFRGVSWLKMKATVWKYGKRSKTLELRWQELKLNKSEFQVFLSWLT